MDLLGPIPPQDARVQALLAEAGLGDVFHPRQHRACLAVDRYTVACALDVARALGLPARLARPLTAEDVAAAGGFTPSFARPLRWLCAFLTRAGVVEAADGGAWVLRTPLPEAPRAAIRAMGLAEDASYGPAYDLLDEAAALWPRVARGETVAERALFLRVRLWQAYFSNDNGYYALQNHVVARAAAARLRDAGGGPVLEVGAGLGSATFALLDALGDDAARLVPAYLASEPVPFFRRRAEQAYATRPAPPAVASADLDVGRSWAAQGVAAGAAALVWGVNVFHLAPDLDATLREAHAALRPGGWLVVGEGLRPTPDAPVAAEFPFQLLESFAAVALDPATRPTAGFLTAACWAAALRRAGFADVTIAPDVPRMQALQPVFMGGAVCGRR